MPQPNQLPTEVEFNEWLAHPVTQLFRNQFLEQWKQNLMNQWALGQFHGTSPAVSFAANANALGEVSMCGKLIELDYDQFHKVLTND